MKSAIYATLIMFGIFAIPCFVWLFGAYVVYPFAQYSGFLEWHTNLDDSTKVIVDVVPCGIGVLLGCWTMFFLMLLKSE